MNIFVSVIVPVFRVEEFLSDCIESILNQTYENFEIILVDDGSDDNCPKICDDYAERFDFIRVIHQTNKGLSAARNTGIMNAKGHYLMFCDSDDMMKPDMIMLMYNTAINNDIDIVMCGYETFPNGKCFSPKVATKKVLNPIDFILSSSSIHSDNDLCFSPRFMFKADLLKKKHILFDENIRFGEDFIFNLTALMESDSIYVLSDPLYVYRTNNPHSIMRSEYKEDLDNKVSTQYLIKKQLSKEYGLTEIQTWADDMADYYAYNFSRMLFKNLMNSTDTKKLGQIKVLLDMPALRDNFDYCHDHKLLFNHGRKNGLFLWACWAKLYIPVYLFIKYIMK